MHVAERILPRSINFHGGQRYRFDPARRDYYNVSCPTIRGHTAPDGHGGLKLAIYAGCFRPTLAGTFNVNRVVEEHGSLRQYLIAQGAIGGSENPRILGVSFHGGPAPSANAVIRGIVIKAYHEKMVVVGFEDGVEGLRNGSAVLLNNKNTWGIHREGDVIIGSSRKNPNEKERREIKESLKRWGIESLVMIGGDDTQSTVIRMAKDGVNVVSVPKTIDNDIPETDITFGHETVVNKASEIIAAELRDARTFNRFVISQIMGRKSGSWAIRAGLAAGVTRTIIGEMFTPEGILELHEASGGNHVMREVLKDICEVVIVDGKRCFDVDELVRIISGKGVDKVNVTLDVDALAHQLAILVNKRVKKGLRYGFILISEGIIDRLPIRIIERDGSGKPVKGIIDGLDQEIRYDDHGNPGLSGIDFSGIITKKLEKLVEHKIIAFPQHGYQYRCIDPISFDIILSTRLGLRAAGLINRREFGRMVRVRDDNVSDIKLEELRTDKETDHLIPRPVDLREDRFGAAMEVERFKGDSWRDQE